jgi:hypothetical protein
MNQRDLDELLESVLQRQSRETEPAAVERVLARLAGPLPPQKRSFRRLPAVLLDWQFAPAWPRLAALAASAVLGFFIGITSLDRGIGNLYAAYAPNGTGLGAVVFEPEPLTGAQP